MNSPYFVFGWRPGGAFGTLWYVGTGREDDPRVYLGPFTDEAEARAVCRDANGRYNGPDEWALRAYWD